MPSPVLLVAAAGLTLLSVHLARTGGGTADRLTARRALAALVAVHALAAFLNGVGAGRLWAGWRGVLALAGLQVVLLGPTLYYTWHLDPDEAILE